MTSTDPSLNAADTAATPAPPDRSVVQDVNRAITHGGSPAEQRAAAEVRALLAPALGDRTDGGPPVSVVDIGANPLDDDAPYALLLASGAARVTGFEPQVEALAELRRRAGPHETYLPHVVGDGRTGTLHLCASPGFAGLFEPDPDQLQVLIDFPGLAAVVDTEQVATRRLDDIEEIQQIDLLKIDIQGGELAVLQAGRRALSEVVAVQTEVGFHRLYRDQPTFADVDLELRSQGLVPHRFVATRTWPMAPVQWADPLELASRQLVEADVLYVRDPARAELLSDGQLARTALIADVGYGSFGLALRCVLELVRRGVLDPESENRYRALAAQRLG